MILRGLFIITILIVLPLESHALSRLYFFRNLDEQNIVSIAPSPSHGVDLSSGGFNFQETCNKASRSCQLKNIASCLTYSQSGSREVYLLVQNNGENPLNVKIMNLPANDIIKETQLASHQIDKIKISSKDELISAISLNSGDEVCIIHVTAPAPQNKHQKYPSFDTYVTPINGAYLLILVFLVGGTLTCFKLRFRGRHLDGVPYHEVEMGNSHALSSINEEHEAETWDQDWDDAWGDEKTVKSNGQDPATVKRANGLTPKSSNSNGKRKEWND